MRRKFTVYGLRFSKTSFWNRINTGFPDHAVATVLTACSIETNSSPSLGIRYVASCNSSYRLQYWNFQLEYILVLLEHKVATVLTACSIETFQPSILFEYTLCQLQQFLPLAVLKHKIIYFSCCRCIESCNSSYRLQYWNLASKTHITEDHDSCNSSYRLQYWNSLASLTYISYLVATVLTACSIETAE